MWRLLSVHAALAVTMALVGCEGGERLAGISDSTFVRTMAELRVLHSRPWTDSAAKAAALDSILQSRGLTPEQLEQAARELANDPERALALWRSIERHARGDTLAPENRVDPEGGGEPR